MDQSCQGCNPPPPFGVLPSLRSPPRHSLATTTTRTQRVRIYLSYLGHASSAGSNDISYFVKHVSDNLLCIRFDKFISGRDVFNPERWAGAIEVDFYSAYPSRFVTRSTRRRLGIARGYLMPSGKVYLSARTDRHGPTLESRSIVDDIKYYI